MLLKPSEPWAMTADGAAQRRGYAARSELALRNALEAFCRERWPDARIVHEIVMGEGRVRADVAAICPAHIAAFEVKGSYDDTTRLLHQVGMYQLCVPEVWIVCDEKHAEDARLIRHLLPSVGLILGTGLNDDGWGRKPSADVVLRVEVEAALRDPVPEMTLRLLWAEECRAACNTAGLTVSPKATRTATLKLLAGLGPKEVMPAVCRQLRGRDALWRADPPTHRDEG